MQWRLVTSDPTTWSDDKAQENDIMKKKSGFNNSSNSFKFIFLIKPLYNLIKY